MCTASRVAFFFFPGSDISASRGGADGVVKAPPASFCSVHGVIEGCWISFAAVPFRATTRNRAFHPLSQLQKCGGRQVLRFVKCLVMTPINGARTIREEHTNSSVIVLQ